MTKRIAVLIGTAVIAASSALFAVARVDDPQTPDENNQQTDSPEMREGRGRFGPGGLLHILRVLDLTEEQKAAVKAIIMRERTTIRPLILEMFKLRLELRKATAHGAFDEEQVRKLARGLADVSAKLLVEKARVWSRIFAILTPDQQDKAELIRNFLQPPLRGRPGEPED